MINRDEFERGVHVARAEFMSNDDLLREIEEAIDRNDYAERRYIKTLVSVLCARAKAGA